jgi:(R)-2-hydroxyacyl-CoA dehydratese activating ATPase
MSLTAGIDIGSITAKAAVLREDQLLGAKVIFTGYHAEGAGRRVFDELLAELAIAPAAIERIVATGYGRKSVLMADRVVTEIMCHAAGARYLDSTVRSLIDIGGQDSKAVVMDENGRVTNFTMNDKCAAGTGRFLEVMARALEADLDEFGALSLRAERPAKISSLCTVFAESEVISLIAAGETRENIIAGIHEAIASRVASMSNRIGLIPPVLMTGGVARNIGVVRALEKELGMPVVVSPRAQVAGAIGAACIAREH